MFQLTAAESEHQMMFAEEIPDNFTLKLTERRFSLLGKNFRYRGAGSRLEHVVCVQKSPLQLLSEKCADGRLAGSHKTHEDNARDAGWQL